MRFFPLLFFILIAFLPFQTFAEELNAGFVQGIWFSKEKVFVDEPVRIYTALRNNTEHDLTGTIKFSVDGDRIDTVIISALPGRLVEAWADWDPTFGEHEIVAKVTDAQINVVGEGSEDVDLQSMVAEYTITVDYDTDGDGIGNEEDEDDDGDSISDEDEIEAGTDPLVFDEVEEDSSEDTDSEQSDNEGPDGTNDTGSESNSGSSNNSNSDTSNSGGSNGSGSSSNQNDREGFEQFFDDGVIDTVLSGVTARSSKAKASLDTYRENRSERLLAQSSNQSSVSSSNKSSDTGSNSSDDESFQSLKQPGSSTEASGETSEDTWDATITRSRIPTEERGLMDTLTGLVQKTFSGLYTVVLFMSSGYLAFPMLVQISLLVLILIILYIVARRIGRRPNQ